jgi:hypothetical protein
VSNKSLRNGTSLINLLGVNLREVALRVLTAIASAFCMMTLCWIGWALATPGDFFANGSSWMLPSEIGAGIVGLVLGWWAIGLWRFIAAVCSAAGILYWVLIPTGWWAHPPR